MPAKPIYGAAPKDSYVVAMLAGVQFHPSCMGQTFCLNMTRHHFIALKQFNACALGELHTQRSIVAFVRTNLS
jgi:hypothetical protein